MVEGVFFVIFVVNGWGWLLVVDFSLGFGLLFWREVEWLRMFCWDCCDVKRMMG